MDRVRFGRVLGVGARQAARTLLSAAEAAAAPDPSPAAAARPSQQRFPSAEAGAPRPTRAVPPVSHLKQAGRSVWSPLARFSSVLWLEVTGTFYAVIAAVLGLETWKARAALHLSPAAPGARRFYLFLALFSVFAYFAVTNFIRAHRRERR
jgi:hypothetical protein